MRKILDKYKLVRGVLYTVFMILANSRDEHCQIAKLLNYYVIIADQSLSFRHHRRNLCSFNILTILPVTPHAGWPEKNYKAGEKRGYIYLKKA